MKLPQIIKTEKVPIYLYIDPEKVEANCLKQIKNIASLDVAFHHVAIMPDTHLGYGMPIGGILALKEAICPNAVGVDIGCGVRLIFTSLKLKDLPKEKLEKILHQIMRSVPTGFNHHKTSQPLPNFLQNIKLPDSFNKEIKGLGRQLGTLGGGNHFIEFQKDGEGKIYIMIHCGSRHFGKKINDYYNRLAKQRCDRERIKLPDRELAYFDINSEIGKEYIYAMNLAIQMAEENRKRISRAIKEILQEEFSAIKFSVDIDVHHNYASSEEHFGRQVWIHRKGAVRASKDRKILVPGSLMTPSYIGIGLGNEDGFCSCAHGAGRVLGRREAKRRYTAEEILQEIEDAGIVLVKAKKSDIAEESIHVYKDIDKVMAEQKDLVKIETRLEPIGVLMG